MGYKTNVGAWSAKGIALNITTTIMFLTPILLTAVGTHLWDQLWKVNVLALAVTLVTPPWGWKKPHPRARRVQPRVQPRDANGRRRSDRIGSDRIGSDALALPPRRAERLIFARRYSDQPHLRGER